MASKKGKKTSSSAVGADAVTPRAPALPPVASAAPVPVPVPRPTPPRAPPPMAHPASADEPTVDLSDAIAARNSPQPTVSIRYAPLTADAEARGARDALVLAPGAYVRVQYDREAMDLGAQGNVARVEMGYRFDDGAPAMAVVADGQRNLQGILLRRAPQVRVAERARSMQLWFRVELDDGRVLWDSMFGHNHRLRVRG